MKSNVDIPDELDPYVAAETLLGRPGRMLSGSKQAPEKKRVVWNGNVLANKMKIWYGDISITDSAWALQKLADMLGTTIFVLREMDARFDNENKPKLKNAVEIFEPGGNNR